MTIADVTKSRMRVVGIDLTGSENRPSGWCYLDGGQAQTRRIRTDQELINESLAVKPAIVSIDSPLSLPRGRTTVFDDDPGRATYGIMRDCERALRRRGVHVYPTLIPSMQRLTARGMALAARLRNLGLPVIEAYPGGAQDILGIPRKRAGLNLLADGLRQFGITGPFLSQVVSHDELDAITAAVVGHFFWSGHFESLGDEEEGCLIVPKIGGENHWGDRLVVGVSGAVGSATPTVELLQSGGWHYARSDRRIGGAFDADNPAVADDGQQRCEPVQSESTGLNCLARPPIRSLPSDADVVIDGLTHPSDRAQLIERFGPRFLHIHIDAPLSAATAGDASNGATGVEYDDASDAGHAEGSPDGLLAGRADKRIPNNGTPRELHRRVMAAIDCARAAQGIQKPGSAFSAL